MSEALTVKQAQLVKGIVAGKTKKQAAVDAGYSERAAGSAASEALRIPKVQQAFERALKKAGLTDEKLAGVLKDGLEANRVVSARIVKSRPTNMDEELAEANQNTDDFIEVPDHATRHKYLETAIKVRRLDPAVKVEHSGGIATLDLTQYFMDA